MTTRLPDDETLPAPDPRHVPQSIRHRSTCSRSAYGDGATSKHWVCSLPDGHVEFNLPHVAWRNAGSDRGIALVAWTETATRRMFDSDPCGG